MCGPLVMLLAKNPFRWWYFCGRFVAFTIAGLMAAEVGMGLFSFLAHYHISALFSLLVGLWIACMGMSLFFKWRLPGTTWLAKKTGKLSGMLARLALKKQPEAIFLFGLSTILLPCGQTVLVFSLIALNGTPLEGLICGSLFALLTSPSLVAALFASQFFTKQRRQYHYWIGGLSFCIGLLAILRGCADLEFIDHLVLNPRYHIVFF